MEAGALPWFALHPDFAAMRLNNVFHDGQAETGTALVAGARFVQTIKSLKYPAFCVLRDSGAIVCHPNVDFIFSGRRCTNDHNSFLRSIFDAVIDQIPQDLLQSIEIGMGEQAGRNLVMQSYLPFVGARLQCHARVSSESRR